MKTSKSYRPYSHMFAGMMLLGTLVGGCDRASNTPKPVTAADKNQAGNHAVALSTAFLSPSVGSLKLATPKAVGNFGQASK